MEQTEHWRGESEGKNGRDGRIEDTKRKRHKADDYSVSTSLPKWGRNGQ